MLLCPPGVFLVGFATRVIAELEVPVIAEQAGPTTFHPRHLTEWYGLFTVIVLGESVTAATRTGGDVDAVTLA